MVEEAKASYNGHQSDNKWKLGGRSNCYSCHTPAGYSVFKPFRYGYDFNVNVH